MQPPNLVGASTEPSTVSGIFPPGANNMVKFCNSAVRNKNRLARAKVSPKQRLLPVKEKLIFSIIICLSYHYLIKNLHKHCQNNWFLFMNFSLFKIINVIKNVINRADKYKLMHFDIGECAKICSKTVGKAHTREVDILFPAS